jgi:uncharacterized phage protein gp47/JayE
MPFARPTLTELVARVRTDFLALSDSVLNRRSFEGVLARVLAGLTHGLHGHLSWIADQILPDRSEDEGVLRWARIFGMDFRPAERATGIVWFDSPTNVALPLGTIMKRDDGVEYEVIDAAALGGTSIVGVQAVEAGSVANGAVDMSNSITLTLSSPVAGVADDGDVQSPGITGGTDVETVDELRERVLQRFASPQVGGGPGNYVTWALEVPGIAGAWEQAVPGSGLVNVLIVEGIAGDDELLIPTADKIQEVQDHIVARAPVITTVSVQAPTFQAVDITLTELDPNDLDVQLAVEAELRALFYREAEPGGVMRRSHINEAISNAEGETDHTVSVPAGDVNASSSSHVLILGSVTFA